jgi:lauroyl/myristoyl acyltransferase
MPYASAWIAERWIECLPALRAWRPGAAWRPRIDLHGAERIEAALRGGHGAVLWVPLFRYSTWVTKVALFDAGYRVSHVSNAGHGLGATPLHLRWLNQLRTRKEEAHLRERLIISGTATSAMRTASHRLAENGLVSITLLPVATGSVAAPFFDRSFAVPLGPPRLSRLAHAPILPVFSTRHRSGRFAVTVEDDLLANGATTEEAARRMVELLEQYCRRFPGQYTGWLGDPPVSRTPPQP